MVSTKSIVLSADGDTTWGIQEVCLAACVFPYMLLLPEEFVESEDNSKEVKEILPLVLSFQ